jgi:hypothetical protein
MGSYVSVRLPQPTAIGTFVVIALAVAAGCDSGPKTGQVRGVVTYKDKAVPEGTVTFYPVTSGRPATGRIQTGGAYELSTFGGDDGAIVGEYKVSVEAKRVVGAAPEPKSLEEELAREGLTAPAQSSIQWLVPREYSSAESSGLTATVSSGKNEIDFNLP